MNKKVYEAVANRADGSCEVCHRSGNLELHHILRRKVPATVSNCIMLCSQCHRSDQGIHGRDGHLLDISLKYKVQQEYFFKGMQQDEVRELMGGRLYG